MFANWLAEVTWGLGSIVWVELVRDFYHLLSHYWTPLYRWHVRHHRVFRRDLTVTDVGAYRQANWYHDTPEAIVMVLFGSVPLWTALQFGPPRLAWLGMAYAGMFLVAAIARGTGLAGADALTDTTHRPGPFEAAPAPWLVNRAYHWRHHFDNQTAYYGGVLTLADKLMGTALSLKDKRIAVTGASGTLGRALLEQLRERGAKVTALTSGVHPIEIASGPIDTTRWQVGAEDELAPLLRDIDILVLNHGVNVHSDRTEAAIWQSFEVNTFSSWRLLEAFLKTVRSNRDIACKEVWINTSEAEVLPAVSPLYELSKRALGNLVTLRRLDAPCTIRKIVLGPFKSNLNPIGIMDAKWVAKQIAAAAGRDARNIIVTINPLTYLLFPLKEFCTATYYRWFSRSAARDPAPALPKTP